MAGKIKTLFKAAEKLEKGASRRVGALGNKGVRIEPGSKVGSAVGGIKDPKTGKVLKKDKIKELTSTGRRRIAGTAAAGAAASTLSGGSDDKPKKKDFTKGVSRGGVPFKEAFSKARKDGKKTFEWNNKKYTTELASEKKKESSSKSETKSTATKKKRGAIFGKDAKFRPFGGVLARALLGDDEKFGGERGLIDFVRTNKKPVKKKLGGMMKAKGYSRGGVTDKKRTVSRAAPREEKLAASRLAAAARASRNTRMGGKEAGSSRARSGAGTGRSISQLSDAQKNLLRSVQSTGRKQPTSVIDDLTKKYGNLAARKQRQTLKAKAPKPPGMQMGGAVGMAGPKGGLQPAAGKRPPTMRSGPREEKLAAAKKAMAMRGAAGRRSGGSTPRGMKAGGMSMKSKMASKGGKMGGMMPPGYKKGGSVGRKKARGVGAAKRGFGRAMR